MRKIEQLRLEALESCRFRGHKMGRFYTALAPPTSNRWLRASHCRVCDAQVVINSRPAPNEIDIMGRAVAVECE